MKKHGTCSQLLTFYFAIVSCFRGCVTLAKRLDLWIVQYLHFVNICSRLFAFTCIVHVFRDDSCRPKSRICEHNLHFANMSRDCFFTITYICSCFRGWFTLAKRRFLNSTCICEYCNYVSSAGGLWKGLFLSKPGQAQAQAQAGASQAKTMPKPKPSPSQAFFLLRCSALFYTTISETALCFSTKS